MTRAAPFIALIGVLVLWQGVVALTGVARFVLPGPWPVAKALWVNAALIWEHTMVTLLEIVLGLALGILLGVATGIALAVSPPMRAILQPVLVFTQALPVFALAPILVLWFGFGIGSKIAMAVLIVYFPVASAFFDGLMRTPKGYLDLAQTMGGGTWSVLWHVRLPCAVPALASGLRLAAVYAPIGAVIGEWVGASRGLGYLMLLANGRVKTDLMFAAVLVLGVLSVVLYLAADRVARRLTRWAGSD